MVGSTVADGRSAVEKFFIGEGIPVTNKTAYDLLSDLLHGADPSPVMALYPMEKYQGLMQLPSL